MATQKQDGLFTDAAVGAADLTGKEGRFCTRASDGKINVSTAGAVIAGVISEGKAADLYSSFNTGGGWLKVIAGAAIAIGDKVQSDANGLAVTGSSNPFGIAKSATSASGEYVEVVPDRT